jgi:hypothetical protein
MTGVALVGKNGTDFCLEKINVNRTWRRLGNQSRSGGNQ